ncbi:MAG: hypothetical protein WB643_07515 [Candidatus Bathyarchaeia archaeon]
MGTMVVVFITCTPSAANESGDAAFILSAVLAPVPKPINGAGLRNRRRQTESSFKSIYPVLEGCVWYMTLGPLLKCTY